jgi:hypothetical protein
LYSRIVHHSECAEHPEWLCLHSSITRATLHNAQGGMGEADSLLHDK